MGQYISFDRAASYYDSTRAWPAAKMTKTLWLLDGEISERQPCVDIGVGTGRVAVPLAEQGHCLYGVDVSVEMLRRLREKPGSDRVPSVGGDARRLPFRDGAFGSAVLTWVLHLVEDWERVLDEAVRVVRPPGVVLVTIGGCPSEGVGPWHDIHRKFAELAELGGNLGADSLDEVDGYMRTLGAWPRPLEPIDSAGDVIPAKLLDDYERGVFSFTWSLDDSTLASVVAETRRWAVEYFQDLDEPLRQNFVTEWRAYDVPAEAGC